MLEKFVIIYLIIGVILECICMYWHKKMFGTLYFNDWQPIYVKFFEGVGAWVLIFPQCLYKFIRWKKMKK